MTMNGYSKACTLMFFCALMVITLFVAHSPLTAGYVGVSKNDYAIYSVLVGLNNTNAAKNIINYYENINNTKWKLKVEEVSGMDVTISVNKTLNNGTKMETYKGNIENGSGNLSMWVILNNLDVDDTIYQGDETNIPRISSITSEEFADAKRDVMYAYFNETQSDAVSLHHAIWNKETGILCGMISMLMYSGEDFLLNVQINLLIIETNLWGKQDSGLGEAAWVITVVLMTIAFSMLASRIILRKRRKTRRHARNLHRHQRIKHSMRFLLIDLHSSFRCIFS